MPHEIWKFENGKHIIIDVRNNHASDTKCEQMMEVECHAAHQPQILNFFQLPLCSSNDVPALWKEINVAFFQHCKILTAALNSMRTIPWILECS